MKNAAESAYQPAEDEEGVADGAASLGADGGPVAPHTHFCKTYTLLRSFSVVPGAPTAEHEGGHAISPFVGAEPRASKPIKLGPEGP